MSKNSSPCLTKDQAKTNAAVADLKAPVKISETKKPLTLATMKKTAAATVAVIALNKLFQLFFDPFVGVF